MVQAQRLSGDPMSPPNPFGDGEAEQAAAAVTAITLESIPADHPVRRFAAVYTEYVSGVHLPNENDIIRSPQALPLFAWGKHIEPIEVDGGVDFKVLRQGERNALRERRTYRDQWMSATLDPEFVTARYREIIAAAVLRRPLFSKGRTPTRERSFLFCLRGIFPVFAENHARLRLFQIEAEPYVSV